MMSMVRRVMPGVRSRLSWAREYILALVASVMGVGLGFGLSSRFQALAVGLYGIGTYCLLIVIDPLKGLILWLVTQPLFDKHLNISLGAGIPDLSLTRFCMALITVLLLARTATRQHPAQPITRFDVVALLFMVGILQCGYRGSRGLLSLQKVFDLYCVPILCYFAAKNLVTSRRAMHLVLYAVLFMAVYTAIYAIYETTTGNVLLKPENTSSYDFYTDANLRILRGIWGSNEGFGRILVMGLPIGFYFYLRTPSAARKVFWAICLGVVFVGLFLTYKRIAWLSTLTVVFIMQLFYPQFRRLFIVLFIVVGVALALNWTDISTSNVYVNRINSKRSTVEHRTGGWEHALEFWRYRPLLGHGLHQYKNLARAAGYEDLTVESEYLHILVSAGLAGFLPYVGLLLLMGYEGFQHYRGRVEGGLADRDLAAVFWAILSGYALTTATAIITNLMVPAVLFTVAGAVIYARREAVVTRPELEQRSTTTVPLVS